MLALKKFGAALKYFISWGFLAIIFLALTIVSFKALELSDNTSLVLSLFSSIAGATLIVGPKYKKAMTDLSTTPSTEPPQKKAARSASGNNEELATNPSTQDANSNRYVPEIEYDLIDVIDILKRGGSSKVRGNRKVKTSVVDHFLYSGRFNSVLGPEGFKIFKAKIKDVFKNVNNDDFGANYINLDKMFEALLDSGIYYEEQHLPPELDFLKKDQRWLTAYRYIAKNFPDVSYVNFREIVRRFKDSRGYSIFIETKDTDFFQHLAKRSELFDEVTDAKAALMQLNQKQLKEICSSITVQPARSIEETANRIIEEYGDSALNFIPEDYKTRKSLVIKDQELATGEDIIHLDSYLRTISKVVRDDLVQFIRKRRWGALAS